VIWVAIFIAAAAAATAADLNHTVLSPAVPFRAVRARRTPVDVIKKWTL
jgi:hypothetical protein